MTEAVKTSLRRFILENFLMTDDNASLEDTQSLIDTGVVDSTGVLEVVQFLEETFDITVEDEDLVPENLDSVENLVRYIDSKGVTS